MKNHLFYFKERQTLIIKVKQIVQLKAEKKEKNQNFKKTKKTVLKTFEEIFEGVKNGEKI